jgi:hypothetical protein
VTERNDDKKYGRVRAQARAQARIDHAKHVYNDGERTQEQFDVIVAAVDDYNDLMRVWTHAKPSPLARCPARTAHGQACQGAVIKGGTFCGAHDPAATAKAAAKRRYHARKQTIDGEYVTAWRAIMRRGEA